jgi:hypothetical protein
MGYKTKSLVTGEFVNILTYLKNYFSFYRDLKRRNCIQMKLNSQWCKK